MLFCLNLNEMFVHLKYLEYLECINQILWLTPRQFPDTTALGQLLKDPPPLPAPSSWSTYYIPKEWIFDSRKSYLT